MHYSLKPCDVLSVCSKEASLWIGATLAMYSILCSDKLRPDSLYYVKYLMNLRDYGIAKCSENFKSLQYLKLETKFLERNFRR